MIGFAAIIATVIAAPPATAIDCPCQLTRLGLVCSSMEYTYSIDDLDSVFAGDLESVLPSLLKRFPTVGARLRLASDDATLAMGKQIVEQLLSAGMKRSAILLEPGDQDVPIGGGASSGHWFTKSRPPPGKVTVTLLGDVAPRPLIDGRDEAAMLLAAVLHPARCTLSARR